MGDTGRVRTPIPAPAPSELARRFRRWAEIDGRGYSPLYERLAEAAAEDETALRILGRARPGQRRPVMFFAALHELVLRGVEHELSEHFPDARPEPRHDDPAPAMLDLCRTHEDELSEIVATRVVQTNEVGRCLALLPALRVASSRVSGPLALVEVGASAGLNLRFDHYSYRYLRSDQDLHAGDADSAVRLQTALVGDLLPPVATIMPDVPIRIGIDIEPLDVANPDDARWLRACAFAEQIERIERLERAVQDAEDDPPRLVAGDAADVLPDLEAEIPDGLPLCLWHSWTFTYFPRPERERFREVVTDISRRRSVIWLSFEDPGTTPEITVPAAEEGAPEGRRMAPLIGIARFTDGELVGRALARAHPHVTWFEWLDAASGL